MSTEIIGTLIGVNEQSVVVAVQCISEARADVVDSLEREWKADGLRTKRVPIAAPLQPNLNRIYEGRL